MAATNRSLFSWDDVENLPDLKRLSLVLDYIPDEKRLLSVDSRPVAPFCRKGNFYTTCPGIAI